MSMAGYRPALEISGATQQSGSLKRSRQKRRCPRGTRRHGCEQCKREITRV